MISIGNDSHARSTKAIARSSTRLWEVDAARTAAIVMMVVYHAGYDIALLAPETGIDVFSGGWRALQVATGSSFLLILGVSLFVADARAKARELSSQDRYLRHARRAIKVLGAGLVVSLGTYAAFGDEYVRFGILQCIGVSMLLAPFFIRLGLLGAPLGLVVISSGLWLEEQRFDTAWLLPLGLRPESGVGVDYYPLLPWFGVALVGLALGRLLYPEGERSPTLARLFGGQGPMRAALGAPGRHSLIIYLIHQPVLIAAVALGIWLVGGDVDLTET